QEDYDTSQDLELDTARIREELGYTEPTSQEEAMRQSIAWERRNPPQKIDPAGFDYAAEDAALATV
ncbi:MAG TPA: hypothetical protein VKT32_01685, partial [Chthonomonadaceae bacterium]|nr:hypothetical protein [Chthonomonadaceae bacterium]